MTDDIVREFLVESNDNLDLLDRELVLLEQNPDDSKLLASIFRTIHTIKGTCGFLGFTKLETVAHVGENLLAKLRDGQVSLTPEIVTTLLRMVDAIRKMLQSIEAEGNEGQRDDEKLIKALTRLQQTAEKAGAETTGGRAAQKSSSNQGKTSPLVTKSAMEDDRAEAGTAKSGDEADEASPAEVRDIAAGAATSSDEHRSEAKSDATAPRSGVSESSIRVDVGLLDKLMNLAGELVLARNQILQFSNTAEHSGLIAPSQRLNLITTELQENVMKTRMQPIDNIWSKFPRTVRDVAVSCGKQVRIEMEGKDTELDKTIIEAIKDPLTHIVRNSVDHGIETPEKRVAAGKPVEGRLLLRAFHEGGQVNIEISDDGAGLDAEKLRRKAVEKKLITAEQAVRMGEREATNLIFLPGLSTAEKVTNVSGRGVGMDVVRTNIERIGGTVDVQSKAGLGTTVKMKIPLTLAIVPGLVVTSAGRRFVVPQVSLIELVRSDQTHTGIEMVHGMPVYRLRGRLLPLAQLDKELQLGREKEEGTPKDMAVNIVVLQADNRQFGLIVDEIKDTEEIVVKPLGRRLKNIKTFAGATIMGDGKVALILDVLGLAQRASLISETHDRALAAAQAEAQERAGDKQTFLLFAGPDEARMALPLDSLARLEEFPVSQVERSGEQWVIQYRENILPLVHLSDALKERRTRRRHPQPTEGGGTLQVLVCNNQGKAIGLVVEKILDIVEDRAEIKSAATRAGVLHAAVIANRVTELLDLSAILQNAEAHHEFQEEREHERVGR